MIGVASTASRGCGAGVARGWAGRRGVELLTEEVDDLRSEGSAEASRRLLGCTTVPNLRVLLDGGALAGVPVRCSFTTSASLSTLLNTGLLLFSLVSIVYGEESGLAATFAVIAVSTCLLRFRRNTGFTCKFYVQGNWQKGLLNLVLNVLFWKTIVTGKQYRYTCAGVAAAALFNRFRGFFTADNGSLPPGVVFLPPLFSGVALLVFFLASDSLSFSF